MIGADIESGRLPRSETAFIGQLVEDICYGNAERYFGFSKTMISDNRKTFYGRATSKPMPAMRLS